MNENTNDPGNPVLTFEGKKYYINELSSEIKLLSISRISLANQLREKLKTLE